MHDLWPLGLLSLIAGIGLGLLLMHLTLKQRAKRTAKKQEAARIIPSQRISNLDLFELPESMRDQQAPKD